MLTRELENARHRSVQEVVGHCADRNSNSGRNGFLRHQDSGAYRPLKVSISVGMFAEQDEVDDVAVDFRLGESGGEGVLYREGFEQRHGWRLACGSHDLNSPAKIGRDRVSDIFRNLQGAAQHFSVLRKIQRAFYQNFQGATEGFVPVAKHNSIRWRDDALPSSAAIARGERPPVTPRTNSSQPFAMSGQLASVVIARSFFQSRAKALRFNTFENTPCNRTKQSWRMIGALHFRASPHVGHNNTRTNDCVQIPFGERAN